MTLQNRSRPQKGTFDAFTYRMERNYVFRMDDKSVNKSKHNSPSVVWQSLHVDVMTS